MCKCKVIALANQKGGVGKTTTCLNLGVGLAKAGHRVLLIDADPQGSLSAHAGLRPDMLPVSLAGVLHNIIINNQGMEATDGIVHHEEGFDLMPGNIHLSPLELDMAHIPEAVRLNTFTTQKTILKVYVDIMKENYDYILIDSNPSLHLLTINALACADYVLIPTQAAYLAIQGLQLLISTINTIQKGLNPDLKILGVLFTITNKQTNYAREIMQIVEEAYGQNIRFFPCDIPKTVKVEESSAAGKSIYAYAPKGNVTQRYTILTAEVLEILEGKKNSNSLESEEKNERR